MELAAMGGDDIANDRQPKSAARRRLVEPHAALEDLRPTHRVETATIVVDRQHGTLVFQGDGYGNPRPRPFAPVLHQIAQHLIEILALPAEHGVVDRVDRNVDGPAGINAIAALRGRSLCDLTLGCDGVADATGWAPEGAVFVDRPLFVAADVVDDLAVVGQRAGRDQRDLAA